MDLDEFMYGRKESIAQYLGRQRIYGKLEVGSDPSKVSHLYCLELASLIAQLNTSKLSNSVLGNLEFRL